MVTMSRLPGPLPVAEEGPFHPFGSRQQRQLGRRHTGAPVVVGWMLMTAASRFGR